MANCTSCPDTDYSCPVKDLSTDCILYTGEALPCSGISTNKVLTEVFQDLDAFICNRFDALTTQGGLKNVGAGLPLYKGVSVTGEKELRSIGSNNQNLINVENAGDLVSINSGVPLLSLIDNVLSLDISNTSGSVNYGNIDLENFKNNETLTVFSNPQNYDLEYTDENNSATNIDLGPIINAYIENNPSTIEGVVLRYLQANPSVICTIIENNCTPNTAPTVDAGENIVLQLPINYEDGVRATITDNDGTIVSVLWTQISGPTQSTITGETTLTPSFSGLTAAGVYEYRVSATDNKGAINSDTLLIDVKQEANLQPTVDSINYTTEDCCSNNSGNEGPQVNAGPDQNISETSTTVTAVASDTDGAVVSYLWEYVEPDTDSTSVSVGASPIIATPNSATTAISGLTEGSHTFKVTATDNDGGKQSDDIVITYTAPIQENTLFNITTGSNNFLLESSRYLNTSGFTLEFDLLEYESSSSGVINSSEIFSTNTAYDLSIPSHRAALEASIITQNENVISAGPWTEVGGIHSVVFQTLYIKTGTPPAENSSEYYITGSRNVFAT